MVQLKKEELILVLKQGAGNHRDKEMLRHLRNKKAQAVTSEYVLVIFLVVAATAGMMTYFKRAIQARVRSARQYMGSEVRQRTTGFYDGNLYAQYEPYYTNTTAMVSRDIEDTTSIQPGGSSGIFRKVFNQITEVGVSSETAPPQDFDLTTPGDS